ncbi:MAG: DUF5069 domain-containing protein [Opitutae bacterium]|nr:DUF5069 domain-containing protein [Opitutae bacterium]
MEEHQDEQGPTGAILRDLPSPYEAHPCGLLHLPRFLAKIRKFLVGELPKSYRRNFTKGFDGFLCLHLGIEPQEVIDMVRDGLSEKEIWIRLEEMLPNDLQAHKWNRKLVQMGMSSMAKEKLEEVKANMGAADRDDLVSFADVIEYDEGRIG